MPLCQAGWAEAKVPSLTGEWSSANNEGSVLRIRFPSVASVQRQRKQRRDLARQARRNNPTLKYLKKRKRSIPPVCVSLIYNLEFQLVKFQFDVQHVTHDGEELYV